VDIVRNVADLKKHAHTPCNDNIRLAYGVREHVSGSWSQSKRRVLVGHEDPGVADDPVVPADHALDVVSPALLV